MECVLERKRVKGQYLNYVSSRPHVGRKEVHSYTATDDKTLARIFTSADEAIEFLAKYGFEATFKIVEVDDDSTNTDRGKS